MKINRNDIKRKTVHKFKYLQYWIFLNPRKLIRLNVNEMTVIYDKNVTIYCPEYFCMLFISDTVIISCGYVFQRNVL